MSKQQITLTPKQQYMLDQVVANQRLEEYEVSRQCIRELEDIATGKTTVEESIRISIERYKDT